jgi:hypothetical protein
MLEKPRPRRYHLGEGRPWQKYPRPFAVRIGIGVDSANHYHQLRRNRSSCRLHLFCVTPGIQREGYAQRVVTESWKKETPQPTAQEIVVADKDTFVLSSVVGMEAT